MNGGYSGNQNGATSKGKYKGEKKRNARVLVEALCIFRFGELSPRFEEMGIQFGSSDRRRVSSRDTKHPIVGGSDWVVLKPANRHSLPFFPHHPSSNYSHRYFNVRVFICTGNKPRGRNEKTGRRPESSSCTFARERALLWNHRLALLSARGWKKRPRRISRVRERRLKIGEMNLSTEPIKNFAKISFY